MARVTVEDCIEKVPNRFELVTLAGVRTRQIAAGAPLLVERDNDKNPVISLREIGDGLLDVDQIREAQVLSYRQYARMEPQEEELEELLEQELSSTSYISDKHLLDSDADEDDDIEDLDEKDSPNADETDIIE